MKTPSGQESGQNQEEAADGSTWTGQCSGSRGSGHFLGFQHGALGCKEVVRAGNMEKLRYGLLKTLSLWILYKFMKMVKYKLVLD